MKNLHITVKDKIAKYNSRDGVIVCNNKDYRLFFTFDQEWEDHNTKTARFIWNGKYYDEPIVDNECAVPAINDADEVTVGVYAGKLATTTPAEIPCLKSILCFDPQLTDGELKDYRDQAIHAAEAARRYYESMRSIVKIEKTDTQGLIDTYAIIYTKGAPDYFSVINGKAGEGGMTATQVDMLNQLFAWYMGTNYVPMKLKKFNISPSETQYDVGKQRNIGLSIMWEFDKTPNIVNLTITQTDANGIQTILNESYESQASGEKKNLAFTVSGYGNIKCSIHGKRQEEGRDTPDDVRSSITINFYNRKYFGYAPQPDHVDSNFITTQLGFGEYATGRTYSTKAKSPADCYTWYAYPTKYGEATPYSNGAPGGFLSPTIVEVTNQYGFKENYYVYRSARLGIGLGDGVPISF